MRASQTKLAMSDRPVTLDRILREAVSDGLRKSYQIEREIPHALLVILMQMNHLEKDAAISASPRSRRGREEGAALPR
jgi:hypothetical protein